MALLAEIDALHDALSGPATKKLMERAFLVFGDTRFERLAGISVSHLYNLRREKPYQNKRRHWTKTRPTGVPIRSSNDNALAESKNGAVVRKYLGYAHIPKNVR
jgi:hypothetical protein